MIKAKDAPQTYTKTYAKKENIAQTRGKTQSGDKVYNTEAERRSKTGPGTVKDRTTYNPKTGTITESTVGAPPIDSDKYKKVKGAYPKTKKEYGYNEAMKSIIDNLLNKAKTYPKVEGYLRSLDKRRIDEGEDVPVTKREKAVRQADENAAKRLEAQGKSISFDDQDIKKGDVSTASNPASRLPKHITGAMKTTMDQLRTKEKDKLKAQGKPALVPKYDIHRYAQASEKAGADEYSPHRNIKSIDDQTAEYFVKCHSHVLFAETEDGLEKKKKEAPKANGHVLGADPKDKRGSDMEMVEADANKSIAVKENKKGKGRQIIYQESGEDLKPFLNRPNTHVQNVGRKGQLVGISTTTREGKTYHEGFKRSEESDLEKDSLTSGEGKGKRSAGWLTSKNRPEYGEAAIRQTSRDYQDIEREGMTSEHTGSSRSGKEYKGTRTTYNPEKGTAKKEIILGSGGKQVKAEKEYTPSPTEKSLRFAIDSLLEKAVYGAGARGGKVERGSHKDTPAHSKVRTATLSPERQKEIEERSRKKARTQAQIGGLHGQAAKLKSIDDRTIDYLEKARQTNEGGDDPRKEENPEKWKQTGDRNQAMHAGIKPKVPEGIAPTSEEEVDRAVSLIRRRYGNNMNRGHGTDYDPSDAFKRSLDYRTIDLVKALTSDREKEIHSAVSKVRMIKHGVEGAEKVTAKPEDVVRAARTHNAIAARTQKSICDKWQESPFITKGARVLPIGPGGDVQDLAKDEKDDEDQGAE